MMARRVAVAWNWIEMSVALRCIALGPLKRKAVVLVQTIRDKRRL